MSLMLDSSSIHPPVAQSLEVLHSPHKNMTTYCCRRHSGSNFRPQCPVSRHTVAYADCAFTHTDQSSHHSIYSTNNHIDYLCVYSRFFTEKQKQYRLISTLGTQTLLFFMDSISLFFLSGSWFKVLRPFFMNTGWKFRGEYNQGKSIWRN